MLEKVFQRHVIRYIESKNGYVVNYNPGALGKTGVADLICCINGVFVAIELKVKHILTQQQALNLVFVNRSGGVGIVLLKENDWKSKIDNLLNSQNIENMRKQTDIIPELYLKKIDWGE